MKKIILIILAVLIFSGIGYTQPIQLTEKELLVQITEKVNFINEGIARIEKNMAMNTEKINALDVRVTVNEQNIYSTLDRVKDLSITWNWLLALFGTLLFGMLLYIWKGTYGDRKSDKKIIE